MYYFSERSFGARLLTAQNILAYLEGFPSYSPPDPNQTVTELTVLIENIIEANAIKSEYEQHYKAAVDQRRKAFHVGPNSILKLIPQIRGAVQAKFGKESQEYKTVTAIVALMNSAKLTAPPPVPIQPNDGTAASDTSTISKSQQSFGSLLNYFKAVISTVGQMNGYAPANSLLQKVNLQTFAESVDDLNKDVAKKYQALYEQRVHRMSLYDLLSDRIQGIKAHVKSQYGVQSQQYKLIKGLSV